MVSSNEDDLRAGKVSQQLGGHLVSQDFPSGTGRMEKIADEGDDVRLMPGHGERELGIKTGMSMEISGREQPKRRSGRHGAEENRRPVVRATRGWLNSGCHVKEAFAFSDGLTSPNYTARLDLAGSRRIR